VGGFRSYLEGGAAVDRHLSDQLLLPAALHAAGLIPAPPGIVPMTRYTVDAVSKHLTTNAEVIRRFLDVEIAIVGREDGEGEVRVQPPGAGAEVLPLQPPEG
jgi:RNA 3'-terminal phosphate cyclase (ATP)